MTAWLGPGKCRGCGARVWYHPGSRVWVDRNPAVLPIRRHVCANPGFAAEVQR